MAKAFKGAGSFLLLVVVVYVAVKYWAQIKAALRPLANAVTSAAAPAGSTSAFPVVNMSPSQPGDPAYSASFGGGTNYIAPPGFGSAGIFGPLPNAGESPKGFNVGPLQTDESASGSPFVNVDTGKYLSGSKHLWDRKPLVE